MLLDVALPYVSLLTILILNADRIFFIYKTRWYSIILSRPLVRASVIMFPWCFSTVIVCTLWLGFKETEPMPGFCMYGITHAANTASMWLTVFMPSILIVILLFFVFIAAMGDMPTQNFIQSCHENSNGGGSNRSPQNSRHDANTNPNPNVNHCLLAHREEEHFVSGHVANNGLTTVASWAGESLLSRHHRRFIAALLTVDVVTLVLTLPFPAFSHMGPSCLDQRTCASLRSLFQTLGWMRSSVVCVRPLFFLVLTDIRQSFIGRRSPRFRSRPNVTSLTEDSGCGYNRERNSTQKQEKLHLTNIANNQSHRAERTTSTVAITPPNSPQGKIPHGHELEEGHQSVEEKEAFL